MNDENDTNETPDNDNERVQLLFGQNVKKYRKQAGLTQEKLAEKLGVSQKHLSIIETGTQFASANLIDRISQELQVSPGDLFGGSSGEIKSRLNEIEASLKSHLVNEIRRYNAILLEEIKQLLETKNNELY